jgi:DNA-binding transcriptional ArsR family regulator
MPIVERKKFGQSGRFALPNQNSQGGGAPPPKYFYRPFSLDGTFPAQPTVLFDLKQPCVFFTCAPIWAALILNHMVKYSPRRLNVVFAALADPTRRGILQCLARGERCVTDVARPHRMSLPAVSKHLRVLEHAGLIRRRRCGRVHQLKLEAKPMQEAAQWIEEYRRFWEGTLDALADFLEKSHSPKKRTKGKT